MGNSLIESVVHGTHLRQNSNSLCSHPFIPDPSLSHPIVPFTHTPGILGQINLILTYPSLVFAPERVNMVMKECLMCCSNFSPHFISGHSSVCQLCLMMQYVETRFTEQEAKLSTGQERISELTHIVENLQDFILANTGVEPSTSAPPPATIPVPQTSPMLDNTSAQEGGGGFLIVKFHCSQGRCLTCPLSHLPNSLL